MEMTKQRKMLIGVLCLGITGLAVDRFVLGSPESAAAQDAEVEVQAPPPLDPLAEAALEAEVVDGSAKTLPSYASLTERLILAQQQEPMLDHERSEQTDPFALPSQWQSDRSKPTAQTQDGTVDEEHRITSLLKLDGTVRSLIDGKEEILAVVSGGGFDGRAIRIGQKINLKTTSGVIDAYVLVEVGVRYVTWESLQTNQRITMHVEEVL